MLDISIFNIQYSIFNVQTIHPQEKLRQATDVPEKGPIVDRTLVFRSVPCRSFAPRAVEHKYLVEQTYFISPPIGIRPLC